MIDICNICLMFWGSNLKTLEVIWILIFRIHFHLFLNNFIDPFGNETFPYDCFTRFLKKTFFFKSWKFLLSNETWLANYTDKSIRNRLENAYPRQDNFPKREANELQRCSNSVNTKVLKKSFMNFFSIKLRWDHFSSFSKDFDFFKYYL